MRGPPEPIPIRPAPVIVKRITLPPMPTFKNFMLSQPDDASPEVFQRRYEDFQVQYVMDFSANFFDNTKGEEWFRERYDPMKQHEMDLETIKWSQSESAVFKAELLEHPALALNALRLDPIPAAAMEKAPSKAQKREREVEPEVEVEAEAAPANELLLADGDVDDNVLEMDDDGAESQRRRAHSSASELAAVDSDRKAIVQTEGDDAADAKAQLPSTQKRTLYLSGIPAECSRSVLAAAVAEASKGAVERVALSPPTWSKNPARGFERNAWIVVPNKTVAHDLMATLRQLRVAVPGPPDPITGDPTVATTFEMTANIHAPRHTQTVPECASHPLRIASDITRAMEVANQLDEDRGIPAGQKLSDLLNPESPENAPLFSVIEKPADWLDIVLTYLRRVHYVMYYTGRKYRDEAQMLSFSPMPVRRAFPTAPTEVAPPVPTATSALHGDSLEAKEAEGGSKEASQSTGDSASSENVTDAGVVGGEVVVEAKQQEEDKEDGEEEGEEKEEAPQPVGFMVSMMEGVNSQPEWKTNSFLYGMDKRIDTMMHEMRTRSKNKDTGKLTVDEEELKALQGEQEKILEVWEKELMKQEPEGKMRCAVEWCNKLFKGPDFLKKHLRTKHLDMATGRLLRASEPFMRRRYEAEELLTRPLPLVPIEAPGGGVETRSVKEILERCNRLPRPVPAPVGMGMGMGMPGMGGRGRGRGGMGGRGRGDFQDRRWSGTGMDIAPGLPMGPPTFFNPAMMGGQFSEGDRGRRQSAPPIPRGPPPQTRPLVSYVDIDAPEVTSTSFNYGLVLPPPPKKRKLSLPPPPAGKME